MRKIAVVTGSRADYWLLRPLMQKLGPDSLILIATGDHLTGSGIRQILEDKFVIHKEIECLIQKDTYLAMAKAISRGIANFSEAFCELKPDIIVVLGDRYEAYAVASAAYSLKIPLAHIHGGEVTRGALDDGYRHAISKMANLHFVSHEDYRQRLLRMGEGPTTVFTVGAIGLDNLRPFDFKDREGFFTRYPELKDKDYFILTFHSPTLTHRLLNDQTHAIITALESFSEYTIAVTQSNMDPGGIYLNKVWSEWASINKRIHFIPTFGDDYLLAATFSKIIIGNSSSGILEIPYLNRPVLNIGDRQEGRVVPKGVYCAEVNAEDISAKIQEILDRYQGSDRIYGNPGEISKNIADVLLHIPLEGIIYKRFHDAKE